MSVAVRMAEIQHPESSADLRQAMRHLAGGVCVITAGVGEDRTGMTVTSAASLAVDPPTMIVCVNRTSSSFPVITRHRHFCVNVLSHHQAEVADRFAGRGGVKGVERYEGAEWRVLSTGALALVGALASIDCRVEEIIERHSHGIVLGAVEAIHADGQGAPLAYWHGRYRQLAD